ncbi:cytochrome P450 71A1-like [Arachis stenosperma]|uniref:cytochrome P450 71A1-like n=1 Tax=Arachis stenosperma TaxID=217475 RepID=UPI0025AC8391|nr:cytochrome P450 71A1-like [Arachis stenosperma]
MAPIAYVLKQLPYELNSTLYLSILVGTISILLVLNLIITRKRNKSINLPPSPPKLPFIGNLHQLGTLTHRSFKELSNKHGPLMFLQLGQIPTLVISSAKVAKKIVKNQDIIFSNRPQTTAANIFFYGCKDLGFIPYGEEWRQKRKVCVLELLSLKRVKSFLPIREQEVVELVDTISKACSRDESPSSFVINLSELMIATSNNIVSRCVLGQKYDTPDGSGHGSFGELGRKVMGQLTQFCVGDFFPTLGWIDVVRGLISEFNATFVELDSFLNGVIEEHKKNKKNDGEDDNKDFVDILLHLQEKDLLEFELTLEDLKAMLMDMFVGGSDTTSTNLEWIFTELLRNPNTMKKVQEEIRRIVGNKSKVDENDINQMNYLKCVIKEGLRLHPPVPILVPRQTTSNAKVKGYDIPSKTTVYYNVWAIHRDPQLWENPEEFIPERFENIQNDYKGQDFQLLPFGTGRRVCPGISFGISSTEIILANLLYWFDWKLPTNENGELMQDIDMSEMSGITVSKKVPLHLHPIPYSI